jgi:hypothetical protein
MLHPCYFPQLNDKAHKDCNHTCDVFSFKNEWHAHIVYVQIAMGKHEKLAYVKEPLLVYIGFNEFDA